jgi:hypothetical protein
MNSVLGCIEVDVVVDFSKMEIPLIDIIIRTGFVYDLIRSVRASSRLLLNTFE